MKANELNKFTKEEIIWALGKRFDWLESRGDNTISIIINEIELKRSQEQHEKQQQIMSQERMAMNKYFEFGIQMQKKYGTKEVKFVDLTHEEIDTLIKLKQNWDDLREKDARIEAKIQRDIKKLLKG